MRTLTKGIEVGTLSAMLERFNVPTSTAFRQKFHLNIQQFYTALRLYQGVRYGY